MNHRVTPSLRGGTSRALRYLSLLLLPALAPKAGLSLPRARPIPDTERRRTNDAPYLQTFGALPLRFERPLPPPEVLTQPAAAAPPNPALSLTESTVAQANAEAAQSTTTLLPDPTSKPDAAVAPSPLPPAKPVPPSILPDDTRPATRPEDFLPFFQVPGSSRGQGDLKVIVPVPVSPSSGPALPPSSATYTQSPR